MWVWEIKFVWPLMNNVSIFYKLRKIEANTSGY